tara:strand:+ start:154 stop:834 length:681 start_codon:yes stop_codon:yes gene_type:complete
VKIAIVGLGGSYADYISARVASQEFDEIWGINCIGGVIHVDRTFMMDPVHRFIDTENAGSQTGIAREFLAKNTKPIYSCTTHPDFPAIEPYPLESVTKDTGFCYFNNTVAYAVAYAVWKQVEKICLYGIDFTYKNVNMAESGRACVEFWCAIAVSKGIKLEVAHRSGLLDTNVPDNEKLYGYHRLKDPLVQTVQDGHLLITKQSEIEAPEPVEASDPVIFGRHDHV